MKKTILLAAMASLIAFPALAQFSGPSAATKPGTAAQAKDSLPGTYVTLTGNLVAHVRRDIYTFRDASGDIRVEIDPEIWQNRPVKPETKVKLMGEVDLVITGRYISVESLQTVP
jgi:uncharacterized protein (TIGR00156 family)